ncbi:hypothetical protein FQR65_LT00911 [Abscondita terminalis]|nr:hypothetical protein FQR65_LT00911 [Abscondita terminalis]
MGLQALNRFDKNNPIYSKFETFIENLSCVVEKILAPELAGEYAVVCHGDVQTKNFLFKYDNDSQPDIPTDLCFLDLQISQTSSPCLDIAFFIWYALLNSFVIDITKNYFKSRIMDNNEIEIPDYVKKVIDKICTDFKINQCYVLQAASPIKLGENWLGQILKITAKIDNNENLNVIAKIPPASNIYRDLFSLRIAFEREIYMYKEVIPEFKKIQQENKIKDVFEPFVNCLETSLDERREIIVLQNMNLRGYRTLNQNQAVDYEHASLAMKTLGKYHALSFALREQKPELFKKLGNNTKEIFFISTIRPLYVQVTQNLGDQILNYLPKNSEVFRKFQSFIKDPNFVIDKIMNPELAGVYSVIGHGDFQSKNLMFSYENKLNPDSPTKLCVLDWQLSRIGSPCLDVSTFLWLCTDKNLRNRHYDELLKIYYTNFSWFLKKLGGNPEKSFPLVVFKEHLKHFSIAGLFLSIWMILTNITDSHDTPDITGYDSIEQAIDAYSSNVSNETYLTTIENLIHDFIKCGYDF